MECLLVILVLIAAPVIGAILAYAAAFAFGGCVLVISGGLLIWVVTLIVQILT